MNERSIASTTRIIKLEERNRIKNMIISGFAIFGAISIIIKIKLTYKAAKSGTLTIRRLLEIWL